jgi:tRNA 5-methylaminomethyl-2-thiouridine biosynthesis bifunctional protein
LTANLIGSAQLPVTVRCSVEVTALTATENSWRVSLGTGEDLTSSTVILCGAYEVTRLSQTSWIPLEAIRGQTAQSFATPLSEKLKTLISFGGYITPADDGSHFIGAHYRHNDMNETPTEGDTAEVISRLYAALPSISGLTPNSSRVCFRASTHDRLPYIGELPSHDKPPLFINAGHGSRGLITAPMGGEIIARMIHKEKLEDLAESASIASAERIEKRRPRVHL